MRLFGYAELSERWNITPSTLSVWKHRGKLPPPDVQWSKSPAWYESTIEAVEEELGLGSSTSG